MKKKLLWFRDMLWIIFCGAFIIGIFGLYIIPKSIYSYAYGRLFKNTLPWYIGDDINGISLVFPNETVVINWQCLAERYNIKERRPVKKAYKDKDKLFIYFETDDTKVLRKVVIPLTSSLINTY